MADLTSSDYEYFQSRGLAADDIERQLSLLRADRSSLRLARPCRAGDGIEILETEKQAFLTRVFESSEFSRAAFVPASGAATRMFRDLLAWREGSREPSVSAAVDRIAEQAAHLPFALSEGARQDVSRLVAELLSREALDLAGLPKGLLPFHRYGAGARTAFAEHLAEAVHYLKESGTSRLHFTVSAPHQARFESALSAARDELEARNRCRYDVSFSTQEPRTDTVCLDVSGDLIRDSSGAPLLRPGGHGSLLQNLQRVDADVVFIKNIDNVQAESRHEITASWRRVLGGYLVWLRSRITDLLNGLESNGSTDVAREAAVFVQRQLGIRSMFAGDDLSAQWLAHRLDRPLRVCGVVANEGQAGGGPFWVPSADGSISKQIVESAQVSSALEQQEIFQRGTHFNPVDMVCSMKNRRGESYDLEEFVDLDAAFVTEKSVDGRTLRALEWPGLWNGSMAGWNTVFVEIPGDLFAPVKTVLDLLGPLHQPAVASRAAV
ncbi:MAG: DUF4301 family protein [Acidobacteriota bacterium]